MADEKLIVVHHVPFLVKQYSTLIARAYSSELYVLCLSNCFRWLPDICFTTRYHIMSRAMPIKLKISVSSYDVGAAVVQLCVDII